VARSFFRFFNFGENLEETNKFDWNNFYCQSKEDGSLITLFYYDGKWRVTTRGSFANGKINNSDMTWEELFFSVLSREKIDEIDLGTHLSFVFELVSPYNKVVKYYPQPDLFLLTVIINGTGKEISLDGQDSAAQWLGVKRPELYSIKSYADIEKFISEHPESTFEGVVVTDHKGHRIKIKNARYVALHKMRGNGDDLFNIKNLIPFILRDEGEESELFCYFSEVKPYYYKYKKWLDKEFRQIDLLWSKVENIENQKKFALAIADCKWSAILFKAKKLRLHPKDVWKDSADLIIKKVKGKNVND
jgi:hypothetical protein